MIQNAFALIAAHKYRELAQLLRDMNAADIAVLLEEMEESVLPIIYRLLPKELAAETFVEMESDRQELLIRSFNDQELREILDKLFLDDTVNIIEEMPAGVVKRILQNSDSQTRRNINEILQYPQDSAGSMMTIEYVDLKQDISIAQAFEHIRRTGTDKETIYDCYVTDDARRLIGIVTVRTLLLSSVDSMIKDVMDTNVIRVHTHDDQEQVAHQFEKYDFLAIPVVDNENRLVGIVTFDDAMDVIQEENTEDFEKMAALKPSEDSYFNISIFQHAKNRIAWLTFLMVSATFTGFLITHYEHAFEAIPLLVAFIPMLMDTGGNCGSQTSTLVIRGLALDEIHLKDFMRLWTREIRVAFLVGLALACIDFVFVMVIYKDLKVAVVTGLTLCFVVMLAKTLGCVMPMVAKRLRMDPALMSAPLITSITDCLCLLVYFNVAMRVMGI